MWAALKAIRINGELVLIADHGPSKPGQRQVIDGKKY